MFYIQTIAIPFLIAVGLYFIWRPRSAESTINYGLGLVVIVFLYSLLAYQLEMAYIWTSGWVFTSLIVFLLPISVVLVILKVIELLIKRKPYRTEHIKMASIYKLPGKATCYMHKEKVRAVFG